jgi:hypothetical protein
VLGYYASHPPSYERGLLGLQVKSYMLMRTSTVLKYSKHQD